MPRISITLPPITITKGGGAATPVRLERRRFDEESLYGVGVVMSDGSFKFLRYQDDGVCYALYDWEDMNAINVNWYASGSRFNCLDDNIYSEYEDAVEWADVLFESSYDYVFESRFYFAYFKLTVLGVTFVSARVFDGDTVEEYGIPYRDWHILTDSLPAVTTIEDSGNTALAFAKDGLLFLAHDDDAGSVEVDDGDMLLYLEGCELFGYEDSNVTYLDNGAVNIDGAFDSCSYDPDLSSYINTTGHLRFTMFGVEYIATFPIETTQIPLDVMTVSLYD